MDKNKNVQLATSVCDEISASHEIIISFLIYYKYYNYLSGYHINIILKLI